jgi:hypothetical protein
LNLARAVEDALGAAGEVVITARAREAVRNSVAEFNLEADNLIDVKRLPTTVTDLDSFIGHLRTIKQAIEADNLAGNTYERDRNNHIEGKKPSYMLDGSLKRYKLGVCCLHAIHAWGQEGGNLAYIGTLSEHVDEISEYASRNPPRTLGQGGTKMWNATFSGGLPRTKNFLALILRWMTQDANLPAAGGGGNDGNGGQDPDGEENLVGDDEGGNDGGGGQGGNPGLPPLEVVEEEKTGA